MYSTLFKQNNVLIISLKPLNAIVEFAVPSIYVVKDILEIISRDSQRPECCMWEIRLYKVNPKRIRRFLSRILDWFNSRMPFFVNKIWLWKCSDSKTVFLFWWQKCYMSPFLSSKQDEFPTSPPPISCGGKKCAKCTMESFRLYVIIVDNRARLTFFQDVIGLCQTSFEQA